MRPWKTLSCLVPDVADPFHHPAIAQNAHDPRLPFDALDDTAALELRQLLGVDVIRWRHIFLDQVAQIKKPWSMTPGRMSTNSHRMARKRVKGAHARASRSCVTLAG